MSSRFCWGVYALGMAVCLAALPAFGSGYILSEISEESAKCIECHKKESTVIYEQWASSAHYRGNIGCYECHKAEPDDPDALEHESTLIAIIVSPRDCARCHEREVEEFAGSHHSKAGRIMGSLDNVLAEVIEGNRGMVTPMFPMGVSAAAVNGCWQCHGSEVQVLPNGELDVATWPNTGIGRINPDGSEGSCSACHSRHAFSAHQARNPENCGKCHMGPDHPQIEIYNESKHGIAFRANIDKMNMRNPKWIVGEDYNSAPTCATCHISATKNQPVTHDVGMRISWNNRPITSVRPETSDAKMGLPGKDVPWQTRRANMQDVCRNCHNEKYVDAFYVQYDSLLELYTDKFAKPGKALIALAKPLKSSVNFAEKIDWTWFELWHHEGRRARHGVSMMGPDITHWHGTYEIAKHFYSKFIPELRELVERGHASDDAAMKQAADALEKKIDEVLNSSNHKWILDKLDPEEATSRKERQTEFQQRYK